MAKLPTQFASAERASKDEIKKAADFYESAAFIKVMLDAVPDMLLILNSHRQTVFANEASLRSLNIPSRSEALGQRPGELVGCAHATETEGGCGTAEFCRNCGAVKAILSSLQGVESVQECQITLKNGDALDLRASAKPFQANDQQFSIFTLQDISGEKRRRALERIFFHDVLNTAGILSMCAEIMMNDAHDTSNLIEEMSRSTQRLLSEIRSQQDLMTAESGELTPEFMTVEIQGFLNDLAQQYEHHEVASQRHIKVIAAESTLMLTSDPTLLGRVVGNMLKNALEATRPGDTVTVSCAKSQNGVTFAVHNPTFMPRNIQLQIFNRSFSTKGPGRGLGTYSMKLLSERYLGGSVRFESTPEGGTTFFATYPSE